MRNALRAVAAKLRAWASRLRSGASALDPGLLRAALKDPGGSVRRGLERWRGKPHRWKVRVMAVALLAAGIGLAALDARTIALYYRVATTAAGTVPLGDAVRRSAREKAEQLAATLDRRLDKKRRFALDAWTSARILIALVDNDPHYARSVERIRIERHFRSLAGPECACWRVLPHGRYPNHIGVTSWALRALAAYGIAAQTAEIRFLLAMQHRDGGWPLYAGAAAGRFQSSYATAAAIEALHAQAALQRDPKTRERLAAAARAGADWLTQHAVPGSARWSDYPSSRKGGGESLGLSGFVLVALHRVGAPELERLDREWLRSLPRDAPDALAADASAEIVPVGRKSHLDRTRYYALPWSVLATALAYPRASVADRVRALAWLERALAPGTSVYALTGREKNAAVAAESLLALSETLGASP
jgi:hypothetical protein